MKLVFASNNAHKLDEVRKILPADIEVVSLAQIGFCSEIDETGTTLEANSLIKAETIHDWLKQHPEVEADGIFADDTGLEIDALGGAPGVYTARWAGEDCIAANNRAKALSELNGITNRHARFRTVVTLIRGEKTEQVDGVVTGKIAEKEYGDGGFGYDPVFIPEGYDKTFAELPAEVKNSISHRARAMEALRRILVILVVLFAPLGIWAEDETVSYGVMGQWKMHNVYTHTNRVELGSDCVYGLADGSLFSVERLGYEITTYDRTTGLSGSLITDIAYAEQNHLLVIAYNNGMIDLMDDNRQISLMADLYIKSKDIQLIINKLRCHRNTAYVATNFGLVTLNLDRQEVSSTCYIGEKGSAVDVADVTVLGDTIYAVTTNHLLYGARIGTVLEDYANWHLSNRLPEVEAALWAENIKRDGDAEWLAGGEKGIIRRTTDDEETFHVIGPYDSRGWRMLMAGQKLIVTPGSRWASESLRPGNLSVYEDGHWSVIRQKDVDESGEFFRDIVHFAVDPYDNRHFYACAYGGGVFEFRDHKLYHRYGSVKAGGPFESALDESSPLYENYVRTDGGVFDEQGNLWVENAGNVTYPIKIMTPDSIWHKLTLKGNIYSTPGTILIDQRHPNWKWLLSCRSGTGVILLDDNGTPTYAADDKVLKRSSFVDQKGNEISPTYLYCHVQDRNGAIWLGTDAGVFIIEHENFFSSNACTRPLIPRNDGTILADYLLSTEQINAIAVDGANRKWIATAASGLYVVSPDGLETIHHFTEENSNLPSSVVLSVAINSVTGEVFVGTDRGIASYRSDASEPEETMSEVYAYPNPVRPNYEGLITITRLMDSSWINITDEAGNLVYKTRSYGGTATWDGRNQYGQRVASGVYSVLCNAADSGKHTVVKILIMN